MNLNQEKYLNNLPAEMADKPVVIQPYKPELLGIAENIMDRIKSELPQAEVRFMGASALRISGQNDIDIYVLVNSTQRDGYVEKLNILFGEQTQNSWNWKQDGFEVTVYLDDPKNPALQEQILIFEKLKDDPALLKKYEALKTSMNGKTYREYQEAKYNFYNQILE